MQANRRFMTGTLGLLMMLAPTMAAAQTPRFDLPISVGQEIWITSSDGTVASGRVAHLTPATVELGQDSDRVNVAVGDVRQIQIKDPVGDGAAKGALALGLPFGALLIMCGDWCEGGQLLAVAVVSGAGALLGAALDAMNLTTIYERENTGPTIGLQPIVSAAGKGLGVRVRW